MTWREIIESDPIKNSQDKIANALQAIIKASDDYTKNKSKKWQETYDWEIQEILKIEEYVHQHSEDEATHDKLSAAQVKLHNIWKTWLDKRVHATGAKWTRVDNKCSKDFFESHKGKKIKSKLKNY